MLYKLTCFSSGYQAELNAVNYLKNNNYTILKHRYKTKYGEIDIIAQKNNTVVFLEIKYRKKIEQAAYAITEKQKHRILNCSKIYIQENNLENQNFRFDAILINNTTINHIKNIIYDNIEY